MPLPEALLFLVTGSLFGLMVAQQVATVGFYIAARRNERQTVLRPEGVLPRHVIEIGTVFVGFASVAVWLGIHDRNFVFVGLNVVLLATANLSVWSITKFEHRHYKNSRPRPRLPYDR